MATYTLPARELPLDDSWDVIVCGGGPAGCTAATAAAREGAKTLLVEATGCLGGMGTSGLVPAWCPFSDHEKVIYKGLAERVFNESRKTMHHVDAKQLDWVAIDAEQLKRVYDNMVSEAGVTVLFNTVLSAVESENGSVSHLIFSNKSGLSAYKAKVYIDCTGDADLATWAGAEFAQGDDSGDLQPATHCFTIANVDTYGYLFQRQRDNQYPIARIIDSGKYPEIIDRHFCNNLIGPNVVGFNAGHLWDVDNTDPFSVSRALIQGRKIAAAFRDALAEFAPEAFANGHLVSTGALMGVRETRRIIGDYILTIEDYVTKRSFADDIARNSYPIDVHHGKDKIEANRKGDFQCMNEFKRYGAGESHGIPYRCLTPKSLTNVLVAGRSISCDRIVQGSVRVMPVCLAMGEAAGIAAYHALQQPEQNVHTIDVQQLRTRLREYGAYLPEGDTVSA
ncbi:MAG TPA: FAD-dependent oxidoreductase [Armatimonadota bacterium]|nr:FAD-dependent oxidoreductase [Armatimonadota bacterium]